MKKKDLLALIKQGQKIFPSDVELMKIEKHARVKTYNLKRGRGSEFADRLAKMAAWNDENEVLEALAEAGQIPRFCATRTVNYTLMIAAWTRDEAEDKAQNMDDESWDYDGAEVDVDETPYYDDVVGYHITEPMDEPHDLCLDCVDLDRVNRADAIGEVTWIMVKDREGRRCSFCGKEL